MQQNSSVLFAYGTCSPLSLPWLSIHYPQLLSIRTSSVILCTTSLLRPQGKSELLLPGLPWHLPTMSLSSCCLDMTAPSPHTLEHLNTCCSAGEAILKGYRTFRREHLTGTSRSPGEESWGSPGHFHYLFSFCFLFCQDVGRSGIPVVHFCHYELPAPMTSPLWWAISPQPWAKLNPAVSWFTSENIN